MRIDNPYVQYMYSYPHKTAYRRLDGIDLKTFFPYLAGQENSLYFHIPFCQYKCGYCNLFSLAGQPESMMEQYVDAMERQAEQMRKVLPAGVEFADLTLGGGTPLILPEYLLERVFRISEEYFNFRSGECAVGERMNPERESLGFQSSAHPIVVETSPNQTTEQKLWLLKEHGVTRLSIGVQSFQEKELETLCRFHRAETAKRALQDIRKVGFSCVNIDLIYGIPGQTKESLLDSLEQALDFQPEELFIYPLYVKPGTALHQQGAKQHPETFEMYQCVRERLEKAGYHSYSMRRFVRGAKNVQETSLCGFGNTISVGCGGRSYIGNLHFCTPYAVQQEHCISLVENYIRKKDYMNVAFGYLLSDDEQKHRYVIKHILFGQGISRKDYRQHFGGEAEQDFEPIAKWLDEGYAVRTENYITLTDQGIALSDYLGPQLISDEVREKMKSWREIGI